MRREVPLHRSSNLFRYVVWAAGAVSTAVVTTGSGIAGSRFSKSWCGRSFLGRGHDLELATRPRPGPWGESQDADSGEGREAQDERVHVAASPPARMCEGRMHGRGV